VTTVPLFNKKAGWFVKKWGVFIKKVGCFNRNSVFYQKAGCFVKKWGVFIKKQAVFSKKSAVWFNKFLFFNKNQQFGLTNRCGSSCQFGASSLVWIKLPVPQAAVLCRNFLNYFVACLPVSPGVAMFYAGMNIF
jgi:hypothetical protein